MCYSCKGLSVTFVTLIYHVHCRCKTTVACHRRRRVRCGVKLKFHGSSFLVVSWWHLADMRTCPTRPTASRDDSVEFQFNSRHQWIQAFKSVHTASAHMTLYPSYVIDGDKQQTRNIAFVALVFTARRYAKRGICRRRVSVCLCVYVCVCVCPSHSGIASKRLNVGLRK